MSQMNIAMDVAVIIMMVGVLLACAMKREPQRHYKLMLAIILLDIASLISNMYLWLNTGDPQRVLLVKILFGANYLFLYGIMILFHYFLLSRISVYAKISKFLYYIIIPVSAIGTFLFFSSFYNGMYFSFDEYGEYVSGNLGWVSSLIRIALVVIDIVITFTYCRKIGFWNTTVLLMYCIIPTVSFLFDDKYRLSLVYIFISAMILVDYIGIGVRQDILIADQQRRMAEQEKKLAEEQTKIMISQIQPHFLYNVISSIMSFCKQDPDKARDALADFSEYLRTNMKSLSLESPVPFEKELDHVKTYIRLEKFRFEERLNIEYDINEMNFCLPSLTLQPIVENAVKHGIGQRVEGGTVKVRTCSDSDGVTVTVEDDGVGFSEKEYNDEMLNGKSEHIGIANVRSRLEAMSSGRLEITSQPGKGTTATIFLPFKNSDS